MKDRWHQDTIDSSLPTDILVGTKRVSLLVPAKPQATLVASVTGDGVDPYWGKLWDAAVDSANCLVASNLTPGARAIEIGCGCGLLGIAGLMCGLNVTFSDHEPQAVKLAAKNAGLNGFEEFDCSLLDWSEPVDRKFDYVIASDVLYQETSHAFILDLAAKMLAPGGKLMIGDPGRRLLRNFLSLASRRNWVFKLFDKDMNETLVPPNGQFSWIVGRVGN